MSSSIARKPLPRLEFEMTLLMWRNHFTCDILAESGSAHIQSLCKWGPSQFTQRTRVLPSGRPPEESETLVQDDPTWALEYAHFKALCSSGAKTDLANDSGSIACCSVWALRRQLREVRDEAAGRRLRRHDPSRPRLGGVAVPDAASTSCASMPMPRLIRRLARQDWPVLEPGLDELIRSNAGAQRFTDAKADLGGCDVVYVAPDVPTDDQGTSDVSGLTALIRDVAATMNPDAVMVVLSQVPPGFTRALGVLPPQRLYYQVETLVFGQAVERATKPERFIVGCADPAAPLDPRFRAVLDAFGCPILPMRYESAELAKISINCCLVASVTVANTLAELCETNRRRLVGDRAGAEARPPHRRLCLSHARPRHRRRQSRARPRHGAAPVRRPRHRGGPGLGLAAQQPAPTGLAVAATA